MLRKVSLSILFILTVTLTLSGCSTFTGDKETGEKAIIYQADWPYYESVSSLVENVDYVFEGKVQDISFAVIDIRTGETINTPSDDGTLYLYTVYEIETRNVLKGSNSEKKYIAVMGGIPGFKEDVQLSLMEQCGINDHGSIIPTLQESKLLEIGSEYMFLARNLNEDHLCIPNPDQFAFSKDTDTTDTIPSYSSILKYFDEK